MYNVFAPCYLYFDGKNDNVHVKSPKLNKLVSEYTVSAWVNADDMKGWRAIRNNKGWSKNDNHFQFRNNKLEFSVHSNKPYNVWWKMTFQEKTWYHLAVTYSVKQKTAVLYVNGKQSQTFKYSKALPVRLEGFDIGSWGNSRRFQGQIIDVRVYDRVLSQSEIEDNMMFKKMTKKNLQGQWLLLEGKGNKVFDWTGKGNNGDVQGKAAWVCKERPVVVEKNYTIQIQDDDQCL
jgi:hypothetical protein